MIGKVRVTTSTEDGIWLHFSSKNGPATGLSLEAIKRGHIIAKGIHEWAVEVLKRKNVYLAEDHCDDTKEGIDWKVLYGDPIHGKVMASFKDKHLAMECMDAWNEGRVIENTCISYHPDNCCGCTWFYYSAIEQSLIAVCNECGEHRITLSE